MNLTPAPECPICTYKFQGDTGCARHPVPRPFLICSKHPIMRDEACGTCWEAKDRNDAKGV